MMTNTVIRWQAPSPRLRGREGILRLIEAGELRQYDVLVWDQPQRGRRYVAVVMPDGQLWPLGATEPSTAPSTAAGPAVASWRCWVCQRDGETLHVKRLRLTQAAA